MNGGTVWNQDYRGLNRKPELGVTGRGQQSRLQRCSQRSARDALFEHHPFIRLDAGRLHDRQEARFLSIAECLDLGRRGRPGRGAKIRCSARLICLNANRSVSTSLENASGRNFPRRSPARLVAHDDIHVVVHSVQAPKQTID
jgi:hypothetical protein